MLSTFNTWEKELDYVENLIKLDWRNNSAWNQRYFVLTSTTDMNKELKIKEIEYVFHANIIINNIRSHSTQLTDPFI